MIDCELSLEVSLLNIQWMPQDGKPKDSFYRFYSQNFFNLVTNKGWIANFSYDNPLVEIFWADYCMDGRPFIRKA